MRCWQWSLQYNTAHTQMSSSAYNLKGGMFTARVDATVRAVAPLFQPQANQEYQVHICHLDESNFVQTVISSTTQSPSTADRRVYLFPITTTLEAGKRYAVLIGRTDGSPTNPLAINFTEHAQWLWPVSNPTSARLAALTPSIGNLVDDNGTSTLTPPFGLDIEF